MKARIAIVGRYALGGLSESVLRGFLAAGYDATLVPYGNWKPNLYSERWRGSALVSRLAVLAARPIAEARLAAAVRELRPELTLLLKCDDLHAGTYAALRRVAPVAAFHPDDPFNQGSRWRPGPIHRRALVQLRQVDHLFLWSRALVARARAEGARRVSYLPFAADPELHHPLTLSPADLETYGCEVGFVGNWDPERERWLAAVADRDLAIWGGPYWSTRCRDPRLRRAFRGRALIGDELARAVLASRVSLNVLRVQNEDACNMRTFEIPACGGFMLHERSHDLGGLFAVGTECDDFGSERELVEKVRRWLADDAGRERIARAGHAAAARQTYREWAHALLAATRAVERAA